MAFIITKYIHYTGILILFATCFLEYQLLDNVLKRSAIKRLMLVDIAFGASALIVLLTGLAMVLWFAKPLGYYLSNWIFHLKGSLFILIGLISAYPTFFFIRNRKGDLQDEVRLPRGIKQVVRLELLGLLCIPLMGTLMAVGYGVIK